MCVDLELDCQGIQVDLYCSVNNISKLPMQASSPMPETACDEAEATLASEAEATLASLPRELQMSILLPVDVYTLGAVASASRDCRSCVEQVLRRGDTALPSDELSTLFWRERRRALAHVAHTLAAGAQHSVVIDSSDAQLHTFGSDEHQRGLLGHGLLSTERSCVPTRVPWPVLVPRERFVAVATHSLHTLALTATGGVFSFGHGECGKLGHGNEEAHWSPRRIEALENERLVAITAGEQHSLVLSDTGVAYSFGSGFGGKVARPGPTTRVATTADSSPLLSCRPPSTLLVAR